LHGRVAADPGGCGDGGDTIQVPDPRTLAAPAARYVLTGGALVVDKSLTIEGAGARLVTIDGNQQDRVFDLTPTAGMLTMSGVTVTTRCALGWRREVEVPA
jgi:hypothetical protein